VRLLGQASNKYKLFSTIVKICVKKCVIVTVCTMQARQILICFVRNVLQTYAVYCFFTIHSTGVNMSLFKLSAVAIAVATLAACQSMSGAGSASQKAGSAMSGGAQKAGGQMAGGAQKAGNGISGMSNGMTQRAGGGQQAAKVVAPAATVAAPVAMVAAPVVYAAPAPVMSAASGLRTTTLEAAAGSDYPPARVGECYARVVNPAVYGTSSERVLKRASSSSIAVVPATYTTGEERVLVRAASTRLEVVPGTFEDVTERVLVKPAGTQLVSVPGSYKTVSERRLVKPASSVWKRSSELTAAERALQNIDPNAGDVLCLIEIPAEYATVSSQVVDQAPSTRSIEIPAEYTTVTRTVVKTPPTTRSVDIPAEYRTIQTTKLATPAREVRTEIPAEYDTVTNTALIKAASSEWRQIVCETNATPAKLAEIQRALTSAGFATGRADGAVDAGTMAAVRGFQKAKGLPVDMDRYINVATVRALGLSEK
jgi:predicted small secreted protein